MSSSALPIGLERRRTWLYLLLLCGVLLALAAGRPLAVPDEGRYGEIGRWMLQSGDWLTPRLNGIPFFHKPPYLYWLEAVALASFGVNVWALRLVPALHAALMLVALYLATRAIGTEQLARRALLMLGTSLSFLIGGQYLNHDMLVAAWIGVAIWCFALAFARAAGPAAPALPGTASLWVKHRPQAGLARLGFVACGMGVLSKGLIGLALPGLVLLIWLLWTRRIRQVIRLPWISGLALFALLTVPWFALAQQQYPGMLDYMFGTHQVGRYTGTNFNNARPWWFYLLALCLLLFPWLFFAAAQAVGGMRRTAPAAGPVGPEWVSLCWIWLLAILLFFSLPNSKLVGYMLPVMPPLALLSSLGFERLLQSWRHRERLFAGLCALALGLGVAANVLAARFTAGKGSRDIAALLRCELRPGGTVYALDGFPYDLPFYAVAPRAMVALQDWPTLRRNAIDGWQRELFEGAAFDPAAGAVLQTPEVLVAAGAAAGNWLVLPHGRANALSLPTGWVLVRAGQGWDLLRSGASAAKGPVPAEHEGLGGCQQ